MIKPLLVSFAALAAMTAAAAPAAAQPWGGHGDYGRYGAYQGGDRDDRLTTPYVDSLDWKIRETAREGRISWGEARELRGELRSVHDLAWRNQTGEIRPWEYRRLAGVVRHIEARTTAYAYNGYGPRDWRR